MSLDPLESIARAVLYEGYSLYPYRPSSLKNRQRWTFGGVYPRLWSESQGGSDLWWIQTECLLRADEWTELDVCARFLQMQERTDAASDSPWSGTQEALEREVRIPRARARGWIDSPQTTSFNFEAGVQTHNGIERRRQGLCGEVEIHAARVVDEVLRLTVRVRNTSELGMSDRSEALLHSLCSTHLALQVTSGTFFSLADPPEALRAAADSCKNIGAWPALVGNPTRADTILSSPIILSDYPRIAPESRGDLFDGTEIDEILTLRILTLTDDEKQQARQSDERVRALLDRVDASGIEALKELHGAARATSCRHRSGVDLRPGDKVRLRPRERADIFDLALANRVATIETIEVDFEDRSYLAVTVDDDPGQDLGRTGQPGHRFFFQPHEVEPL